MSPTAYAALYCLFVWWFSTGLIVLLNNLPAAHLQGQFFGLHRHCRRIALPPRRGQPRCQRYRRLRCVHLCRAGLGLARNGVLHGLRDGAAQRPRARTTATAAMHFGHGVQACIDHELAILGTGVAVLWATWGAPNHVGLWTFMILWGMRLSAKLNVFLGVLNLGEPFLPEAPEIPAQLHVPPPHELAYAGLAGRWRGHHHSAHDRPGGKTRHQRVPRRRPHLPHYDDGAWRAGTRDARGAATFYCVVVLVVATARQTPVSGAGPHVPSSMRT